MTKALNFIKNKYFISAVLFLVWMAFFDPKDWGLIMDRRNKLEELEVAEKRLTNQIKQTKNELNMLDSDVQSIEQYAREKYFWKKDNEDVFIVKTP
jgi:cell division protein FtsB